MSSLDGLSYNAFAPHVVTPPSVMDYFGQGQQAVQSVLDQQYQAQTRAALLAQQQQKAQLDALLGPIQVQQAQANVAGTTTRTAGDQQSIDQSAQSFPLTLQGLGYRNTIEGVNAQYAAPNAANQNLSNRIGLTLAAQGIGPRTMYNPDGSVASQSPGLTLAGSGPVAPPDNAGTASNASAPDANGYHMTLGTTFATPSDLADYAKNKSLATGDNGVGAWGDDTTGATPYVALPPSTLKAYNIDPNTARGTPVTVQANGKTVQAVVGDKMPDNSSNGAGIDMNPATASGLGISDINNFKGPVSFKIGHDAPPASPVVPPSAGMVSQDGGYLDRAIAQMQAANPGTANLLSDTPPPPALPSNGPVQPGGITSSSLLASNVAPISSDPPTVFANSNGPVAPPVSLNNLAPVGTGARIISSSPLTSAPIQPPVSQGTIPYLIPKIVQGRPDPTTGGIIPDPLHPGNSTIQYQINPDVEKLIGPGGASGVQPSAYVKNNQFDPLAYEDARGANTTELRQSGQQFEQRYLQSQAALNALKTYAALPDSQRNGQGDQQAIIGAVQTETPGIAPSEAAQKAILDKAGFADKWELFQDKFSHPSDTPVLSRVQLDNLVRAASTSTNARAAEYQLFKQQGISGVANQQINGSASTALPQPDPATLAGAQAAIAKGAPRAAVIARLQAGGFDASGL